MSPETLVGLIVEVFALAVIAFAVRVVCSPALREYLRKDWGLLA